MRIEYDEGTLRIESARGYRWHLDNVQKPAFSFSYDGFSISPERAVRLLGSEVLPLSEAEAGEVRKFVENIRPPAGTQQKSLIADLKALAHGLIKSVVTQLEYDALLDVMITAREGSTDIYAEQARRVLAYVDSVWNAFYGLAARIESTPERELRNAKEYAEMMPFPPPMEHFSNIVPEGLFDATPREG
jgi:hypothetical protein